MLMEGEFRLEAPIQEVWGYMLDPATLGSCIPGAEKVEAIDDRTYESVVKQKVGPISVKLKFTTTLTEINPPTYLKAVGNGQEMRKLGTFTQETEVHLTEISAGEVQVSYSSNVRMVGRLATFGERIMRAKAKEIEKKFTKNLQEKLKAKLGQSCDETK